MDKEEVINTIKSIVEMLVKERYEEIFSNDLNKLISAEDIRSAIREYGGMITLPPNEEYLKFDIYEINENKCSADFDLWVNSERSDLTLSCTIFYANGKYEYSIENIHVL